MSGLTKVPEDIVQNWELGGNKLALTTAYLQIADELAEDDRGSWWGQPRGRRDIHK